MTSPSDEWLRQLASDGKGGKSAQLPAIVRGLAYAVTINFEAEYGYDSFAASLKLAPDAVPLDPPVNFGVSVGAYAGGATPLTLSLTDTQTSTLPTDDDGDGLVWLLYDILHTPLEGGQYRIVGGEVPVSGAIT